MNSLSIFSSNRAETKKPVQTQSSWAFRQKQREAMEDWTCKANLALHGTVTNFPKEYRLDDAVGDRLLAEKRSLNIKATQENVHKIPATVDDVINASDIIRNRLEELSTRIEKLEQTNKANAQAA